MPPPRDARTSLLLQVADLTSTFLSQEKQGRPQGRT